MSADQYVVSGTNPPLIAIDGEVAAVFESDGLDIDKLHRENPEFHTILVLKALYTWDRTDSDAYVSQPEAGPVSQGGGY